MRFKLALLGTALCLLALSVASRAQTTTGINLEGYDYPFPELEYSFRSQEQDLVMTYMHEKSSRPNGTTVLLLHGKNFNGAYWGETMKALLEDGYDVIVPDQIGFGKSKKPQAYQYTFQQLAQNTRALLEQAGVEKSVVLGHSMGGMLAIRYALMYPEHTEALFLVNPIGLEDWKLKVPYQSVSDWYQRELKKTAESIKSYQKESYYFGDWKPAYQPWVEVLAAPLESPDYPRLAWNSALTYDMIFTQPVVYEFSEIQVPTVLLIGLKDRTALGKNLVPAKVAETMGRYPELSRSVAQQIPRAQLITFEDLGHLPHIQDFPRFKASLMKALRNYPPNRIP